MKRIGFIDGRRVAGWSFPATAVLGRGQVMTITDPSTIAAGIRRGTYIDYQQTGAKTGSAEVNAVGIDLALKASVPTAYAQALYLSSSGNPTVAFVAPISIYMDNLGSNIGGLVGIDIGIAQNDAPADRFCFMRLRKHGTQVITDGIRIEGTHPLTNLFYFFTDHEPIITAPVGATNNRKIQVRIDATPYYIPLYTS